jgi:hypothetical protein
MSDRMRFTVRPGEEVGINEEEKAVVLPWWPPADVTLPPEMGGSVVDVASSGEQKCPLCNLMHRALYLVNGLTVLECQQAGFVWIRKRKEQP